MTDLLTKAITNYENNKLDRELSTLQGSLARIGLGHTSGHLKTRDWLLFQKDFAKAKDAVHSELRIDNLKILCEQLHLQGLEVHSQAKDIQQFLLRPDLGRRLDFESEKHLKNYTSVYPEAGQADFLLLISGGLSCSAVQKQIPIFLPAFVNLVRSAGLTLAPILLNPRGRVALGDQVNYHFQAHLTIVLIGERPGLTHSDSLGIYFTYNARPGLTDVARNCISNVHDKGLLAEVAAMKLFSFLQIAMERGMSGVNLKDD